MPETNVVKLRLSLMGRPVRNFTFDKELISVGRDPASDVFVDNPGVSRDHFRLERTPNGEYQLVDLGSANGTFLNDQSVNTATLRNNDVVRFGKYTLWVGYEQDRRTGADDIAPKADTERNTVVLSRKEIGTLLEHMKDKEANPPAAPAAVAAPVATPVRVVAPPPPAPIAAVIVAFLLGVSLGAGAVYLLLTR